MRDFICFPDSEIPFGRQPKNEILSTYKATQKLERNITENLEKE